MGIGGNLIASSIIRNLAAQTSKPVVVAGTPRFSDLLSFRFYNKDLSFADDTVFAHNPHIVFPPASSKSPPVAAFDKLTFRILSKLRLTGLYEKFVFKIGRFVGGKNYYYPDMEYLSYAQKVLSDRMIWKKGGHAIDIGLAQFDSQARDHRCEIYFTPEEEKSWGALAQKFELKTPYIVVEPATNLEWFGDLRAWPLDRWQEIVNFLNRDFGGKFQTVQVGVAGSPALHGIKNIVGQTTVRETALILKHARLFLGTEGGLMHLANATSTPAVILWGGLTLPEFAGYPEFHSIICKYVECAPCGLRGNCPYDKKCMNNIEVDEVWKTISSSLSEPTR